MTTQTRQNIKKKLETSILFHTINLWSLPPFYLHCSYVQLERCIFQSAVLFISSISSINQRYKLMPLEKLGHFSKVPWTMTNSYFFIHLFQIKQIKRIKWLPVLCMRNSITIFFFSKIK